MLNRGLEADQRVLAAHGCYALTATTALTAQNTLGVRDIHIVPAAFVKKQIDAGLEDIGTNVIKIGKLCLFFTLTGKSPFLGTFLTTNTEEGMLASTETVDTVSSALKEYNVPTVVLDPVCSASLRSRSGMLGYKPN